MVYSLSSHFFRCNLIPCRYDSEGKESSMASIGVGLSPSSKTGGRSMYTDRVSLSHITGNQSLGDDKVLLLVIHAQESSLNQVMNTLFKTI